MQINPFTKSNSNSKYATLLKTNENESKLRANEFNDASKRKLISNWKSPSWSLPMNFNMLGLGKGKKKYSEM